MKSPLKALFFDFDGVLQDSESLHYEAWIDTLTSLDLETVPVLTLQDTIGKSDLAVAEKLIQLLSLRISIQNFYEKKLLSYRKIVRQKSFNTEKEASVLKKLSDRYLLAIVSSSHSDDIEEFLHTQKLFPFFQFIVAANHIFPHKPDPAPYLFALKKAKVLPNEVLVIEDSDTGLTACKEAGLTAIWMNRHQEAGSSLQCEYHSCIDFDELLLKIHEIDK